MATPTNFNPSDRLVSPAKAEWEDPAVTLERDLEVRAQENPPGAGPDQGFLGPLNSSGTPTPPGGTCQ
jgi:hypothetical protein